VAVEEITVAVEETIVEVLVAEEIITTVISRKGIKKSERK
jgi:hypothetical protein